MSTANDYMISQGFAPRYVNVIIDPQIRRTYNVGEFDDMTTKVSAFLSPRNLTGFIKGAVEAELKKIDPNLLVTVHGD